MFWEKLTGVVFTLNLWDSWVDLSRFEIWLCLRSEFSTQSTCALKEAFKSRLFFECLVWQGGLCIPAGSFVNIAFSTWQKNTTDRLKVAATNTTPKQGQNEVTWQILGLYQCSQNICWSSWHPVSPLLPPQFQQHFKHSPPTLSSADHKYCPSSKFSYPWLRTQSDLNSYPGGTYHSWKRHLKTKV